MEHRSSEPRVGGSSPFWRAKRKGRFFRIDLFPFLALLCPYSCAFFPRSTTTNFPPRAPRSRRKRPLRANAPSVRAIVERDCPNRSALPVIYWFGARRNSEMICVSNSVKSESPVSGVLYSFRPVSYSFLSVLYSFRVLSFHETSINSSRFSRQNIEFLESNRCSYCV